MKKITLKTIFKHYKGALKVHMKTICKRKSGIFLCGILNCEKVFKYADNLERHKQVHTGKTPYECSVCNTCVQKKSALILHQKTALCKKRAGNPGNDFQCEHCDKVFERVENLERHKEFHTGEKPFECPYCNTCFLKQESLARHKKSNLCKRRSGTTLFLTQNCQSDLPPK